MENIELDKVNFVVGCDADGILTNLSSHNIREGKKVFKREPICPEKYSLEEQFDISNIPKFILYSKAFKIYINYCKNEEPREFAPEVINELTDEGLDFHSITARKFATSNSKLGKLARKWFKEWLKKYNINFSSFQFCSEERSPEEKLLACKKLNVDVMIEDKPDVALFLTKNGIKVIMIDAPYNLNTNHENIRHVSDWIQVKTILKKMKQEKENKGKIEFLKKEKVELESLTNQKKIEYFNSYKNYLKNINVNQDAFKKGDKRFKLIYSSLKYPIKSFYKIDIFGKEKVPYQNGFIIASNHSNSTDQYRLGIALGNRPFVGYAAKEIEDSFRGKLFKVTGLGIFVDRNDLENKKESSELMSKYVAHDRIALIFPEGTRKNKTEEGKSRFQNRFKLGTVALAQKTGTGILPVATNAFGNDTVVRFGEFIFVNPIDDLEEVNKKLELEIAKLSFENNIYYLKKNNRISEIDKETRKYNDYLKEVEMPNNIEIEKISNKLL
ncbi:MAG: 1-acyl-sn-glycerol-3-phosphate acyltransferase [Bacilli bacterium]